MSPENQWLEDAFPIAIVTKSLFRFHVNFPGCNTTTDLDLPTSASWMMFGVPIKHPLQVKQHRFL